MKKAFTQTPSPHLAEIASHDAWRTVHDGVKRFFQDERLVQLFDRYATYNGSNPYQAARPLNIIPYVEYGLGGFYIKGGMYRLVEALEQVARALGVRIHWAGRWRKSSRNRDG
jgi:phytoene dehydrogenase-like protein